MGWLSKLYQTYENNASLIGKFEKKSNDQEFALLPVSHTTQTAQIEVSIDSNGNFASAKVVAKEEASTIIPCTDASANRTSKPVPHPLFDKLPYVAGDYMKFGGEAKKANLHREYIDQLQDWCDSPCAHPKVRLVYEYLCKGTLVADLIRAKVILVDERERFVEKWSRELEETHGGKWDLFKTIAGNQSDAFVRFAVHVIGETESRLWRDHTVQESFIQYYNGKLAERDLCFVSGESLPYADKHASRIRHSADMSKLISANDTSGFTFRGRFRESRDAASISYEVSQKAHNALKWLIARQGYSIDGKVFLVWGTEKVEVPDPLGDTFSLYGETSEQVSGDSTDQVFSKQVKLAIGGYRHDTDYRSEVVMMVLEAATPGRMSVVYYRDMNKELFLDRLEHWHQTCYWLHRYKRTDGKYAYLPGAPATKDIAFAAYGQGASDKIVKDLMERMLPSIVDERDIPRDIVRSALHRACNPVSMEEWEWEKTLSIACALINQKEGLGVAVDESNSHRDYLFGRMLAIADVLERRALDRSETRATNAIRYMNSFAQHPGRTWKIIQSNLQPYQARLGSKINYLNARLDEVGDRLKPEDYLDKRPLSGLYLLGFYSQRHELWNEPYRIKKDQGVTGQADLEETNHDDNEGEM